MKGVSAPFILHTSYLIFCILVGCCFFDVLDESFDVVGGGVFEDAVAEVKDMTGAAVGLIEDGIGTIFEFAPRREEGDRIKIPLNRPIVVELRPSPIERHMPIDPHDISTTSRDFGKIGRGAGAEVDHRNARSFEHAE